MKGSSISVRITDLKLYSVIRTVDTKKRNWAIPIPAYKHHEQVKTYIVQQAEQNRQRHHYVKGTIMGNQSHEAAPLA